MRGQTIRAYCTRLTRRNGLSTSWGNPWRNPNGSVMHSSSRADTATQNSSQSCTESRRSFKPLQISERLFNQPAPRLGNPFDQDATLQNYLKRVLPNDVFVEVAADLRRFGDRTVNELADLHRQCEAESPYLRQFDAWGNRVDEIVTSQAWKRMHDISAEEGLVAIAYERKYGPWSRIYQVAKNYLFASTSGMYSCPLAMTDGAAKILESVCQQDSRNHTCMKAFKNLTSRNAAEFWTSGQWMTERRGGSDVARGTETVAVPLQQADENGTHALFGSKWFSSATDSNMALTLARITDADGCVVEGTKGLSLFYVETHGPTGALNNIEIVKMKDKLGTRQLPTAELTLNGTFARLVGVPGRGVADISKMLTITRIHNAISAVSYMRRVVSLARDYSTKRTAFGKLLKDHPLHVHTLAELELETRGAFLFLMDVGRLLGLEECGEATESDKQLLRLLTPILKLSTAKQAVSVVSEGLESFGGQGYIEETGIPNILRDAQVLPIWEGTTNILALDVLRVFKKETPLGTFATTITDLLSRVENKKQEDSFVFFEKVHTKQIKEEMSKVWEWKKFQPTNFQETSARSLAFSLARIYTGVLLVEHACATKNSGDYVAVKRWCDRGMVSLRKECGLFKEDLLIVMEGYQSPTD